MPSPPNMDSLYKPSDQGARKPLWSGALSGHLSTHSNHTRAPKKQGLSAKESQYYDAFSMEERLKGKISSKRERSMYVQYCVLYMVLGWIWKLNNLYEHEYMYDTV